MPAGTGGFALIQRSRKPAPFAPASPSFKAGVSGGDGCLVTRREAKKEEKNHQQQNPDTLNFNY